MPYAAPLRRYSAGGGDAAGAAGAQAADITTRTASPADSPSIGLGKKKRREAAGSEDGDEVGPGGKQPPAAPSPPLPERPSLASLQQQPPPQPPQPLQQQPDQGSLRLEASDLPLRPCLKPAGSLDARPANQPCNISWLDSHGGQQLVTVYEYEPRCGARGAAGVMSRARGRLRTPHAADDGFAHCNSTR